MSLFDGQDVEIRTFCRTTKPLSEDTLIWSCDCEEWRHVFSHLKGPYDLSYMDMLMKCVYGLTPPTRPENSQEHDYIFKFEADGKYFFWLPDSQDRPQLNDVQTDETALEGWASLNCMKMEEDRDGDCCEKLYELEVEQQKLKEQKLVW